jgi:putative dimethyl sulfoxide reductase chaperone
MGTSAGENRREIYVTLAQVRRSVYELLSAFYLDLPDRAMIQSIFDPDFERELSSVASAFETGEIRDGLRLIHGFISSFRKKPEEETLKRIAVDRTKLFRGISEETGPPPPYESVYREQRTDGASRAEVFRFYGKLGVTPPETITESPDYLGVEIDFMRLLCRQEEEAWRNGNPYRALELLSAGLEFLNEHLLKWVPLFCERMFEKAELDFYRGLARFTSGFLTYDSHLVEERFKEIRIHGASDHRPRQG